MTVAQITDAVEEFAPGVYQESYDNAGLIAGSRQSEVTGALLCLDVTERALQKAIDSHINLIISHHPVIFGGLKRLVGSTAAERIVQLAIKHDIALYAAHTNLDSVRGGVSEKMCDKLMLKNRSILQPVKNQLVKVAVYAPLAHAEAVRQAMLAAGAGCIGLYSSCSFSVQGTGTFLAGELAKPFAGKKGELHREVEEKVEVIAHESKVSGVVAAMRTVHPYEEVAYDLYPLLNEYPTVGLGMVGELEKPLETGEFLRLVKQAFNKQSVKYVTSGKPEVCKVAVCGGSGSSLTGKAAACGADAFVSADFKYHQLQEADGRITVVDVGHYESEIFAIEIFYEVITKKFPTFAPYLVKYAINQISYL
ncbi:MAG: Nif3-like dinuclear metal center hexameric protein [Prevotellaceae bacterium]|jgi:dinuclear metal center YbgI/SA1388 family protein|nr:Nif3-like dinuclear metal center hexameric protein [Prevotellaceae bacterium]